MQKALSFLGAAKYETVTYVWEERSHTTRLFPEALARLFGPEKVLIFVTERAKNYRPSESEPRYVEMLQDKLGDLVEWVDIPEGRSEQELWEVFDRVVSAVDEGDTVLLDITHAFRSIPMIVFAVAAYLRRVKGVPVERIVYGAYEARQPFRTPPRPEDRAPVFDLTLLLDLMDWLSGAELLLRRSDASLLAQRIEESHRRAWRIPGGDSLPKQLQSVGRKLRLFSQAMQLARPRDVMHHAHGLRELINATQAEAARWAKPFGVVLDRVQEEVDALAHDAPDRLDTEHLRKQLSLIKDYVEKGLLVQAVLLAREWVVTWMALQLGEGDWLAKDFREREVEGVLNTAAARFRGEAGEIPPRWGEILQHGEVARIWDSLGDLRNDLAHCGMRKEAASIDSIERRVKKIPEWLEGLLRGSSSRVMISGRVVIDVKGLYGDVAKLEDLPDYLERAKEQAGEGNEVVLTGQGPIWLYLAIGHALHGKARRLLYDSPVTGEVVIFDHTAT
jgi:CRISPR-associated DxTHG motif protein